MILDGTNCGFGRGRSPAASSARSKGGFTSPVPCDNVPHTVWKWAGSSPPSPEQLH